MHRRTFLTTMPMVATVAGWAAQAAAESSPRSVNKKPTQFQIACMTLPYSQFPLQRALEGIARSGFKYVAWGTRHLEGPNRQVSLMELDAKPAEAKKLGDRCRDHLGRFGVPGAGPQHERKRTFFDIGSGTRQISRVSWRTTSSALTSQLEFSNKPTEGRPQCRPDDARGLRQPHGRLGQRHSSQRLDRYAQTARESPQWSAHRAGNFADSRTRSHYRPLVPQTRDRGDAEALTRDRRR